MRPRVVATSTATLLAAASLSPMAAQAAGQNTIFVNGSSSACTDSGAGAYAAPFCTLQAAADAVSPGDIVNVAPGTYAPVALTQSGTAAAPITFTGDGVWASGGLSEAAITSFSLSGVSNVRIQNFTLESTSAPNAAVDGGSDVTFDHDDFRAAGAGDTGLYVTDGASAVTLQDSFMHDGVLVDDGSSGTVLTTNIISTSSTNPVSVVDAADTAITSNDLAGCGPAVSVTDSPDGTSIENNIISAVDDATTEALCPGSAQDTGILVDEASAPGTTSDYNDVYTTGTNYEWAGADYSTAAALYAAAGQGQHDDNSSNGETVVEHSPVINSANSAAVGEQPVDINGDPRILDPLVTPTGAGPYDYYDRGATQFQDPVTVQSYTFTASADMAPVGGEITFDATATDTWSDTLDYQIRLDNGSTVDAGTGGKATASFSAPGTYYADLTLVPTNGAPTSTEVGLVRQITVVPAAPLIPALTTTETGPYSVAADSSGTTDSWDIASVAYDFGDGTPTETVTDGTQALHTYAKAGTYTITETVTDAGGNTATTSTKFSTEALVPGTLVNVHSGTTGDAPANSTGIANTAVASLPNGDGQLFAATTGGTAEFATSTDGNTWSSWQTLSQPGVTVKSVGIAGMPNGSSQLIEITSTGQLLHNIRNANGTWQASGWGSPAGSTGFTQAAITAMPDGSSQLVAVTTAGVLMHNIRNANGSWQGWRSLNQPGVKVVDASIAGMPNGSSQIAEVTSTDVMKHNLRNANGSWQASGWGSPAGSTGITQVSISSSSTIGSGSGPGSIIIAAVTSQGGLQRIIRTPSGSWSFWDTGSTPLGLGDLGTAADTAITTLASGVYLIMAVSGG